VSNPLVSIVLCCHNRRAYLELTLESVFTQNYHPVEIIVMDDGSTDGTEALVQRHADKIRYFRQNTQGIAVARTNASREARGEYIAYQDDDDLMPPERISSLYAAFKQFPEAAFATGDFAVIDADGKLTGHRWMPGALDVKEAAVLLPDGQAAVLWPLVPAVPHTTLFRRELGEQIGWFDPNFKHAGEDADFLARLGRLGPVAYVREVVSFYRRGHSSLTGNHIRSCCSRIQLWEKHLKLTGKQKPELSSRLHDRLLNVATRLERYRQDDACDSRFDLNDYVTRALAALPLKHRLGFELQSRIKFPLRRLIKGSAI
jgi:glycosyltransferase involved in cell wall biosynthesis